MSADDDAVGYKRPPKQHQFKSGQSGNPRGRPKKKWRMSVPAQHSKDILEIAEELHEVRTAAGLKKLTMQQLIYRGLAAGAAKGKPTCVKYWMPAYLAVIQERFDRHPSVSLTALLISIAENSDEPDQLLLDTIEGQLQATKNLF